MEFAEYIIGDALILVPALWIVGALIKHAFAKVPNWTIPFVLLVLGIGGAMGLMGLSVGSVIQGILVTGAAVLGNQLVKQGNEAAQK